MRSLIKKAKNIRLAIFDVDGILTSGTLHYGNQGIEYKDFHVHDGLGLKLLQQGGIEVAIITAKHSDIVMKRMSDLGVKYLYQGQADKIPAYDDLKQKLQLKDNEISYMGDDLPDLPVMKRVGLSITAANAPNIIKEHVNWITKAKGGNGAVREACEFILNAQGSYQTIVQSYLDR